MEIEDEYKCNCGADGIVEIEFHCFDGPPDNRYPCQECYEEIKRKRK